MRNPLLKKFSHIGSYTLNARLFGITRVHARSFKATINVGIFGDELFHAIVRTSLPQLCALVSAFKRSGKSVPNFGIVF